jgi:hypothetical protein
MEYRLDSGSASVRLDVLLAHSPADFGKLIADETEKWGNVIRSCGVRGGCGRLAIRFL